MRRIDEVALFIERDILRRIEVRNFDDSPQVTHRVTAVAQGLDIQQRGRHFAEHERGSEILPQMLFRRNRGRSSIGLDRVAIALNATELL